MLICIDYDYSSYYKRGYTRAVETYDCTEAETAGARRLSAGDPRGIAVFAMRTLAKTLGRPITLVLSHVSECLPIPFPLAVACEPVQLSERSDYFDGLREHIQLRDAAQMLPRREPVRSYLRMVSHVFRYMILLAGANLVLLAYLPIWLVAAVFVGCVLAIVSAARGDPVVVAPGFAIITRESVASGRARESVFESVSASAFLSPHWLGWELVLFDDSREAKTVLSTYEAVAFLSIWQGTPSEAVARAVRERVTRIS